MRNPHAIVLRKIRGVFGACWQGTPVRFAGGSAVYPASPTGGSILGAIGAMLGGLLLACSRDGRRGRRSSRSRCRPQPVARRVGEAAHARPWLAGTTATVEIKELTDKVLVAVTEMRSANDEKLKEIEKKGSRRPAARRSRRARERGATALKIELDEVRAATARDRKRRTRVSRRSKRGDARDADVQNARRFLSLTRGKKVVSVTNDDLAEYQAYRNAFGEYLRRGDQALADARDQCRALDGHGAERGLLAHPRHVGQDRRIPRGPLEHAAAREREHDRHRHLRRQL
jgi:hypothetical protein